MSDPFEAARLRRLEKMGAVQAMLAARFGGREFRLADVLDAIRAEGLPPFKTRDRMLRLGMLKFVGQHRADQRYTVEDLLR